jgi:[ribosomal protein S18]-alanine N-acetyltransferase
VRCIADSASGRTSAPFPASRPDVVLRGFQLSDVPVIAEIVADALHERYDSSLYATLSGEWPDGFLVAADRGNVPVAFLLGVNQIEGEARVLMFAVDRGRRAEGIGALLMDTFLARCQARGFRRVTLEVRVSNATAIRFYTRYDYSVIDLLRGYYSDGENGYHMARPL